MSVLASWVAAPVVCMHAVYLSEAAPGEMLPPTIPDTTDAGSANLPTRYGSRDTGWSGYAAGISVDPGHGVGEHPSGRQIGRAHV